MINLNKFQPREYQAPIIDAIENRGYNRVLAILPRRAGKDITAWQLCIRQCLRKICSVYYIFPTFTQAKRVIWQSVTNDGMRFLDYIPPELITTMNSSDLSIRFKNGSLLQLAGSDNYDSLMGTNAYGLVFSEYALQNPLAWPHLKPIIDGSKGWAVFLSTPRGKNHLWDMYNMAIESPNWFVLRMTVEDTKHIPLEEIQKTRDEGIMSEDMIQQEYYVDFTLGVSGAFYTKYLDKMRLEHRIDAVPHDPAHKVHTAWDLGMRDSMAIIFFQTIGTNLHVIDAYSNNKEGLEHYVQVLDRRGYLYGKHFAPHDIKVRELGTGLSRMEKAKQLGIQFVLAPHMPVLDGIEAVRTAFARMWIDEAKCKDLIKSLENYKQEYDVARKIYKEYPLHDWTSHYADAARYMALSVSKTKSGMTGEELDKLYRETVYGGAAQLPPFFR